MKTPLAFLLGVALSAPLFAQAPAASAPASTSATPANAPTPIESLAPRPPLAPATLAKLAQMKPIFDGKTLNGWIQAPLASFRLGREDIPDLQTFAKKIAANSDPVARFLNEQLDDAGRTALASLVTTQPSPREAIGPFFRNLNRIVAAGASIHDAARFKDVTLRPETEALRGRKPQGLELARLNRVLLEDAFPKDITKSPATGWIVKDGAMASTGAGRGSIFTAEDYGHYRLVFQVRQISGNHVPGVLVFCARPPTRGDLAEAQAGIDALGAVQFQVPNGGHWDYRPGVNKAGAHFTRPVRIRFDLKEWAQVEILVNAKTGVARMAVAQPVGTRAIENLVFNDPAAGKPGPIALQMHNAGLFDEFRDLKIELDPKDERLITVE